MVLLQHLEKKKRPGDPIRRRELKRGVGGSIIWKGEKGTYVRRPKVVAALKKLEIIFASDGGSGKAKEALRSVEGRGRWTGCMRTLNCSRGGRKESFSPNQGGQKGKKHERKKL